MFLGSRASRRASPTKLMHITSTMITAPAGTTNYSYSATVGVFRSVVSLILVVTSNALAKMAGEEGVY